ncbi:MAG TPA: FAD-dependent oxidoreductase [Ktedonobacteraceae bacterium]|nr:FAD-dependent oxidoreductase [Ktedonobacteraceae bacterium]
MINEIQDLVIIGGGVMGLCTAYAAAPFGGKITMLERSRIGDKQTASFGYTRSIRNDYLDPQYARLAYEARRLWLQIEQHAEEPILINCGCLNIARESITPDLDASYAEQSYRVLSDLHLKTEIFTREELRERYPQFDADLGRLDVEAGFVYVPAATQTLLAALNERHVRIEEEVEVVAIERLQGKIVVYTGDGSQFATRKLVITAGHGTNDVLARIEGCRTRFPISPDRPSQCRYFLPPAERLEEFVAGALPVFAYLDVGIYGHPIYAGKTPGVKIGYYNPPDVRVACTRIHDIASFIEECMPSLRGVASVDVTDVDQCNYDLVADDNFILGALPDMPDIAVGVGWRGTGYKYAPWVGQTLMQLAFQQGSVYDISRFAPGRFADSADTEITRRKS